MVAAAQKPLLAALLALAAVVDLVQAAPSPSPESLAITPSTSFFSAIDILNVTLGGRVYAAVPLEKPCFSTYQGRHVPMDNATCADVQANYTDPQYRVQHFGAYMLASNPLSVNFLAYLSLLSSRNGKLANLRLQSKDVSWTPPILQTLSPTRVLIASWATFPHIM